MQDAFDSYAKYYIESFRLSSLSARTVERGIDVEGYEHLTDGLDRGNGVILALPHLGVGSGQGDGRPTRATR